LATKNEMTREQAPRKKSEKSSPLRRIPSKNNDSSSNIENALDALESIFSIIDMIYSTLSGAYQVISAPIKSIGNSVASTGGSIGSGLFDTLINLLTPVQTLFNQYQTCTYKS